jgi:hypothetical protein
LIEEAENSNPTRLRVVLILVLAAVLVGAALAAGLSEGTPGTPAATTTAAWRSAPLNTSFVTPSGTWAIVPMGALDDPLNTFWQMFFRPNGKTEWTLVTPPGVADNGGISASIGKDGSVGIAFGPTNLLDFSPAAFTANNGKTWTSGVIPLGTASVPDSIAFQSATGTLEALELGGAGVKLGNPAASNWSTDYTESDIAASPAGRACDPTEITALAGSSTVPVVGATCTVPGKVGLFLQGRNDGSWTDIGPVLPTSDGEFSVLTLQTISANTSAIVDARKGTSNEIFGTWRNAGTRAWSFSGALPLDAGTSIVSSGFAPDGSIVVETQSGSGTLSAARVLSGPGSSWTMLPELPSGTQEVSLSSGGQIDALAVSSSVLTDWQLVTSGWKREQIINVPIQYGSSS